MPQEPTTAQLASLVGQLARLGAHRTALSRGARANAEAGRLLHRIEALIEELESSRASLEEEVRLRTRELEDAKRDKLLLADLSGLLQASQTLQDVDRLVSQRLPAVFNGLSGALYTGSADTFALHTCWGALDAPPTIHATDCWALRLRLPHNVQAIQPTTSCRHVRHRTGDSICVPLNAHGEAMGLLLLMGPGLPGGHGSQLSGATRQLAAAVGEQIGLTLSNLEMRKELQFWALRDPLTGLYNRRFVDEWIAHQISQSSRSGRALGIAMIDVDNFKEANDVHGHDAGDALLRAVADLFSSAVRAGDIVGRYGGDEFVILLPGITLRTLVERAESFRERIAAMRVRYREGTLPSVTASTGVAVYPLHGSSAPDLLHTADSALYAAKRAGRNRTCSPPSGDPSS